MVADNDFYLTPSMYTDCGGIADPNGACACAENAIDVKGTLGVAEPSAEDFVRFTGNRFWGFRPTDKTCGGTGSGGDAIVLHLEANHVLIEDNVFFDSHVGINTPNTLPHSLSIINNLFAGIPGAAIAGLNKSEHVEVYYNTILDSRMSIAGGGESHEVLCNLFIDAPRRWSSAVADHNAYYNSARIANPGISDLRLWTASQALNADYVTEIRRITGPEEIRIANALTTLDSPHAALCATVPVGETLGLGVDDTVYGRPTAGFVPPR